MIGSGFIATVGGMWSAFMLGLQAFFLTFS